MVTPADEGRIHSIEYVMVTAADKGRLHGIEAERLVQRLGTLPARRPDLAEDYVVRLAGVHASLAVYWQLVADHSFDGDATPGPLFDTSADDGEAEARYVPRGPDGVGVGLAIVGGACIAGALVHPFVTLVVFVPGVFFLLASFVHMVLPPSRQG